MVAELHEPARKIGIILPDGDALASQRTLSRIAALAGEGGVLVLSQENCTAPMTALRDVLPKSCLVDARLLSVPRLMRLCDAVYVWDGAECKPVPFHPAPAHNAQTRLGLVISNGYGLGHVTRMAAFARGLEPYAPISRMSFSAGLWRDVFYMPSQQYLDLDDARGDAYTLQACLRFIAREAPSHIVYDGNVIPNGLLAALARHPHIHFTWVRRGMWHPQTRPIHMARQALADLVIEPGDLAEAYDTGPSWNARHTYCPPRAFLKTPPMRLAYETLPREQALHALNLPLDGRHALIMLGAQKGDEDRDSLKTVVHAVRAQGLTPVIAHWPMAQTPPPVIEGAITIECMPLAPFYAAFDVVISAAGYNSFHELMAGDRPVIFVPQEDAGRDQQLARAQWAAEKGYAQICRRDDLDSLPSVLAASAAPSQREAIWLNDWRVVAKAMDLNAGAAAPAPQTQLAWRHMPKLMRAAQRRIKKRHGVTGTRFMLALDMSAQTFLKKTSALRSHDIVITNSIDPVVLRRAGCKYLWLNADTEYGLRRQLLTWLRLWLPVRIKRL